MDSRYEILDKACKAINPYAKSVTMKITCLDPDAPYNQSFDVTLNTDGHWNASKWVFQFLINFDDMLRDVNIVEQEIDEDSKLQDTMRLFYHDESEPKSYQEVYEACQKGYGIKEPEKISGFNGFFFKLHDIYLYGKLAKVVETNPQLEEQLNEFINRFKCEDYGFVTADEYDVNMENKWLCGSCTGAIARYSFSEGGKSTMYSGVVLQFFKDKGVFYFVDDDVLHLS